MSRSRTADGKYDYDNFDLMCVCGHRLGVHCAPNDTPMRDCMNGDVGDGKPCGCKNFERQRAGKEASFMSERDGCPIYCKYCGAKLKRDNVGHYCPTRNCQWQYGVSGCPVRAAAKEKG